jgi:hypothetical protein
MSTQGQPILDDLFKLLSPSARAALAEEFKSNEKAKEMVAQGLTFRAAYLEGEEPLPVETPEQIAAKKAEADRAAAAEAERLRAAGASHRNNGGEGGVNAGELKGITEQLTKLSSTLEEKLKNVITRDQLPMLEGQVLEKAIFNASMVMEMKAEHKSTFGEDLDLGKLNSYLEEQKKAGRSFSNIRSVYDDMMHEKMMQKKIADGIAEGLKQKRSSEAVPGQSSPAALSPAQVVLKTARGSDATNVNDYTEKLRKIREAREGTGEGAAA